MKRSRAALKTKPGEDNEEVREKAGNSKDDLNTKLEIAKPSKIVQLTNFKKEDLKKKLKSEKSENAIQLAQLSVPNKISEQTKNRLNLKNLKNREKKDEEELKPTVGPSKNKPRAVVDLQAMKEELKQLHDPPVAPWEKELSSARLQYSFFDTSCEQLAQNLLGKVLVRCLENGTILKGRIVETEGYLGAVDKASHSYQNKVTPRNIPMYMPPGTIYVYMTYGMYHCFNISSQEPGSFVQVNALEPLFGIDYMELLQNMQLEENGKQKKIVKNVQHFDRYQLCNSPTKICTAFDIDSDRFSYETMYECKDIWLEAVDKTGITIVPTRAKLSDTESDTLRYYVLGSPSITHRDSQCDGCAVLIRAVEALEGIEQMTVQRTKKSKTNGSKSASKSLKPHELCNGPSKLCMAFQLEKSHSKYSMCSWKGLWLENENVDEEFKIVRSTRIGIDSCGPEWANKPLRYYVYGSKSVSKRDKKAEILMGLS